jgi:hypothetical protein
MLEESGNEGKRAEGEKVEENHKRFPKFEEQLVAPNFDAERNPSVRL